MSTVASHALLTLRDTYWLRRKSDGKHAEPKPIVQLPRTQTPWSSLQLPQQMETTRVMKHSRCFTRLNCSLRRGTWCLLAIESTTVAAGTQEELLETAAATAAVAFGTLSGGRFVRKANRGSCAAPQTERRAARVERKHARSPLNRGRDDMLSMIGARDLAGAVFPDSATECEQQSHAYRNPRLEPTHISRVNTSESQHLPSDKAGNVLYHIHPEHT